MHFESWKDSKPELLKRWEYKGDSRTPSYQAEINRKENTQVEKHFDSAGLIVRENSDKQVETSYHRNSRGQVVKEVRISPAGKEEWDYEYDEKGEILKESYSRRANLEKVRIYTGEDLWYEEIYRAGEIFLIVYYSKSEKVREVFIKDGEVVTERVYKLE